MQNTVQEDPEWTAEKELCMRKGIPYVAPTKMEVVEDEEFQAAEASKMSVGSRCEVNPGGKRGCIRYALAIPGHQPSPLVTVGSVHSEAPYDVRALPTHARNESYRRVERLRSLAVVSCLHGGLDNSIMVAHH